MRYLKGIIIIIVLLVVLVASIQNYNAFKTSVQFRLNLWVLKAETPELSIFSVSLISFLLGAFITLLLTVADNIRLRLKVKSLSKASQALSQALAPRAIETPSSQSPIEEQAKN